MHALQEKRRAVKSLWVGSRAVLLRALTLDLVLQIFAVTVWRWPTTFPSEDIPTTLYGLCCHGQSLLTTPTPWSACGMKTACCTHRCSHQYLSVPTGKAKSRHHRTTTVDHKTNTDQTLAHSPTPTSASSPQPPLSQAADMTVAKKCLLKAMPCKSS